MAITLSKGGLWGLLILLVVLPALLAVGLGPMLGPEPILLATPEPACDLRAGPCTARFPGVGEVTLAVTPPGIPVLRPLDLRVLTRDLAVSEVAVDFAGTDMDMGYNRPSLKPDGPGRFHGQGMLPTCVRNPMNWEARVLLSTPRGLLAAPFRFAAWR